MNTIIEIKQKIEKALSLIKKGYDTQYFNVENKKNEITKIRVSNHSMNKQNNSDTKTLSFILERTKQNKSAYNQSAYEWVILENGLTDTYQTIDEILENEL